MTRADGTAGEGLRARKKRRTRELISDTATALFVERGFDAVTVVEVALACEVSEKTVYNYFPTKESLVLDRETGWAASMRAALGPDGPSGSPVDAVVAVLVEQLDHLAGDLPAVRRVGELIHRTPGLRAANAEMTDRIVDVAAEALAARVGMAPDDPEPRVAAEALVGLWRVQFHALRRDTGGAVEPVAVRERVIEEVSRAARVVDAGLASFLGTDPPAT